MSNKTIHSIMEAISFFRYNNEEEYFRLGWLFADYLAGELLLHGVIFEHSKLFFYFQASDFHEHDTSLVPFKEGIKAFFCKKYPSLRVIFGRLMLLQSPVKYTLMVDFQFEGEICTNPFYNFKGSKKDTYFQSPIYRKHLNLDKGALWQVHLISQKNADSFITDLLYLAAEEEGIKLDKKPVSHQAFFPTSVYISAILRSMEEQPFLKEQVKAIYLNTFGDFLLKAFNEFLGVNVSLVYPDNREAFVSPEQVEKLPRLLHVTYAFPDPIIVVTDENIDLQLLFSYLPFNAVFNEDIALIGPSNTDTEPSVLVAGVSKNLRLSLNDFLITSRRLHQKKD